MARTWKWLWLGPCTCALLVACRTPPPPHAVKTPKPATANAAGLPGAPTPTAPGPMSLPTPATLADAVDPADFVTPADRKSIDFDDVPWLLDRAGAWLRAHAGGAAVQPTVWQRRDLHGWQTDVLKWQPGSFTLQTQGDDTTVTLTASACTVGVGKFVARCEPDVEGPAAVAAALTGLAWPDGPGRDAWFVEAVHTRSPGAISVRLALANTGVRAVIELAEDGAVTAINVPRAQMTLRPDADGFALRQSDGVTWQWSVQPPGGSPDFARNVLRLDNAADLEVTVEAWEAVAKPRGLTPMGPFSAEVDVRDDGVRVRALQAPVLARPEEAAWKGVQVASVKQQPIASVFACVRQDLLKVLRKQVGPGCHVLQLLGGSLDEPPAVSGEARRTARVVVAVRACP